MQLEGFPRGKGVAEGGVVTRKARKGDDDQLFKTKTTKRSRVEDEGTKQKGKKKKGVLTGEEERVLAGRQKIGERGFDIQQLTYETISEGLLTLGTVSSIRDPQEVIVSLPGRTVGSIALADVNRPFSALVEKTLQGKGRKEDDEEETPSLSSIFFVGQTVCVRVDGKSTNKEGKTRIRLSSCPTKINGNGWVSGEVKVGLTLPGALVSEGDKAWEVDTGINGIKAFLQKSKIPGGETFGDLPLSVGRLLFFRVDSCGGSAFRKTVQLSLVDPKKGASNIPDDMPLTYTQLLPGMSFREVVIIESHRTGIKVHLHDELTGLLWQDHVGPDKAKGEEGTHKAQVLRGVRVLYVNPLSVAPTPYLTLQKKAVPFCGKNKLKGPAGPPVKVGSVVEVVVDTIQKRGMLVRFGHVKGIVPAGRLSDNLLKQADTENKKDAVTIGQKKKCMIVGYSEWDELFIGSFQESLLQGKTITSAGQLKVGQVLKNVSVLSWTSGGALVDLTSSSGGSRVKAFLPRSQLPPSVKAPLETKYPVGSSIQSVRVTEVNESKCHVIVTALNALVKSKGSVIGSYEEISTMLKEGKEVKSHGVVKDVIKDQGLTIRLLGGVIGFVPNSKMREERRQTQGGVKPGQVVEVKVFSVAEHKGRTRMILIFADDAEFVSEKNAVKRKIDNSETKTEVAAPPPSKKPKVDKSKKTKNKKSKNKVVAEDPPQKNQQEAEGLTVPLPKKILRISEEEDAFDFSNNITKLDVPRVVKTSKKVIQKKKEEEEEEASSESEDAEETQKKGDGESHDSLKLTEEQLRQSLRVNPRDGEAWVKLAYLILHEAGGRDIGNRGAADVASRRLSKVVEEGVAALSGIESPQKVVLWALAVALERYIGKSGQDTSDLVQKKLNEGMKAVDPVELILKTGKAFEYTKHYKEAETVYKRGLKMDETRVPPAYARMLYAAGKSSNVPDVFKSIVAHAKDPLKLTVEQGSLELELGDKKKGLDLYNIVLGGGGSKMKKRTDLLSIMLNGTIKYGSKDDVWSVFEKIMDMSIPPLRLRGLLKRMKEYEESHGTSESKAKFKTLAAKVVTSGVAQA